MTLDTAPLGIIGRRVRVKSDQSDFTGLVVSFSGEADEIGYSIGSKQAFLASPPHYSMTIMVGATRIDLENLDHSTQIDLL